MKKKLTAILIALTIAVSLLPVPAMAAVSDDEKEQIKAIVSDLILDYADKVYQPESDDEAFSIFFKHGFFGNHKDMVLTESSPVVSTLFNAKLMQQALINGITNSIATMQNMNLSFIHSRGGPAWHDYNYGVSTYSAYIGGEKRDPANYLGSIYTLNKYTGPRNDNDTVMELLGGGVSTYVTLTEQEIKGNTVVYDLKLTIDDYFDFTSDYDKVKKYGYDTSKDQALVNMGFLLTYVGLDEFNWSYEVSFRLEVPYRHTHGTHNYHFTYDGSTISVSSESGNGYTHNPVTQKTYTYESPSTGNMVTTYHHELRDPVVLRHDKPWVMEWDQTALRNLQFGVGNPGSNNVYPTVYSQGNNYVRLYFYEYILLDDGKTAIPNYYYVGVETKDKFAYSSKHSYTHTLENKVSPDGSNMMYLSIYDHDLGETVFGPEPMDDRWDKKNKETEFTKVSESSDYAVGHDIIINYLGNKSYALGSPSTVLDLRIWENGKDAAPEQGDYTAPTCTEQGGTRFVCNKCGKMYFTDIAPALGHDFGEYLSDNNAACLIDGTETRSCTRCGLKDTRTVTGSALGHDFGEYMYDENAACLTDGTKTRACSRCDVTESLPAEGTALGHDFGKFVSDNNATCTANGTKTRTCTRCDAKESATDIGTAKGHSYTPVITAPTCTEGGYTTYTCHCGDSYIADETPAVGHTEVEDPAIPATCISSGKKAGSHCSVCGVVTKEQELIPLGNHSWDQGTVIKEPTLNEMGTLMYTCIHCDSKNYMSIDKLPTLGFSDVPADAYYATPVAWAKNKGITSGLSETLFGSDMSCTRGQVVTFLWAAAGRPEPTGTDNPFTDVYASDYYYKPVLWAVEQGITGGIGDGLFGPHQECTRGQIVTFLWRAMNSPEPAGENTFTDVAVTDWFAQPVLWASENSVTGGIGNGMFGPYQECTRAQVVTFLYKVYN